MARKMSSSVKPKIRKDMDIYTALVYIAVIIGAVRAFCGPFVIVIKEKEK